MSAGDSPARSALLQLASHVPMWFRYRLMDLRGRGVYEGIPNQYKCIFIHVPKAAGSSVALTLFGQPSRHVPYFEYERANPWKFRRYFKFAFVRNPWDRLVSTYFFLRKGGMNEPDRRWSVEHLTEFPDFDSFVRGWVEEGNVWSWVHFRPQHYFICDERLELKMDFVGRMENMEVDYAYVATRLGCKRTLQVVNKGAHRDYREYYSPETREIVGHVYAVDIRLFDYRFEAQHDIV